MNRRKFFVMLTAMSGLALSPVSPVWADEPKDGHKHEEHEHKAPTTYAEAVKQIRASADEIKEMIESKKLGHVHEEAEVIMNTAKSLGKLALAKDSGVPKESVKDVNAAGKALAAHADELHDAADKNDLAGTKAHYEKVVEQIKLLEKHVPAK